LSTCAINSTYADDSWIAGDIYTDTIGFAGLSATSFIGYAFTESSDFSDGTYSGIVGAAFADASVIGSNNAFMSITTQNGLPQTFTTCFTLTGGSLIVGEDLTNAPAATYTFQSVTPYFNNPPGYAYWNFDLTNIQVAGTSLVFTSTPSLAAIDSGTSFIGLEASIYSSFKSALFNYCATVNAIPFVCRANGQPVAADQSLLNNFAFQLTAADMAKFPTITVALGALVVDITPSSYLTSQGGGFFALQIVSSNANIFGTPWYLAAGRVAHDMQALRYVY